MLVEHGELLRELARLAHRGGSRTRARPLAATLVDDARTHALHSELPHPSQWQLWLLGTGVLCLPSPFIDKHRDDAKPHTNG